MILRIIITQMAAQFNVLLEERFLRCCYDLGSSLRKRNDLQGKDGSTSSLCTLTNGSVWTDLEDNISGARVSGSKGESMATMAEVGVEDTSSDGY